MIQNVNLPYSLKFQENSQIMKKKLLVGAVYIPPENSKYSSRDSLSMVELEML